MARQRSATKARTGQRSYHHGDLRRALVDAAFEILQDEGLAGLTLRKAASATGVSQAAPYRHFADKEALVAAVAERGFRLLTESLRAAAARTDLPLALRFRAQGEAYVRFALRHAALFQLMFGREPARRTGYAELDTAAQETFQVLVGTIRAGQQAGMLSVGQPEDLAIGAWCMVHGLSALLLDGQFRAAASTEAAIEAALRTLFFGLRRTDADPPQETRPASPRLPPR